MNEAFRALAALAACQHQVFGPGQASAAGLTRHALRRHVLAGRLLPVGTHTYRFAGTALTWRGSLQAGLLDLGGDALVAGRSAAALFGLDGFAEGPLEFRVPRDQRSRRTIGSVRSGPPVSALDRCVVDGLACASATLAVIQVAAAGSRIEVANALDSAVRLRLTSPEFVRRRLAACRHRGLPGLEMLDEVVRDAGVESWLERRFLELVRAAGLPEPARQCVYNRDGRQIARVDFDFAPVPVLGEVGGQKGYLTRRERQRQERRRTELQLLGKVVYFFSYEDITEDPAYVVSTLEHVVGRAA